jgi:hypothetical protein
MQSNRFEAIAAELSRLAAEIVTLNARPFDPEFEGRAADEAFRSSVEPSGDRQMAPIDGDLTGSDTKKTKVD